MTTVIARAQDAILNYIDPEGVAIGGITKEWPGADLQTVLIIIATYLLFVAIAPRIMASRAPVDPYGLKFAYNISQMLLCAYMTVEAGLLAYRHGYTVIPQCVPFVGVVEQGGSSGGWGQSSVTRGIGDEPPVAKLLWLFYVSKIWDFWDTVFIVLGKKWRQLSFLHVYHHTTIFAFYWPMT